MLCPKLSTQGQFIGESAKGLAFAFQDCSKEYKNIGANAKPLQVYFDQPLMARIIYDINLFAIDHYLKV
jgi:hypothetical protein